VQRTPDLQKSGSQRKNGSRESFQIDRGGRQEGLNTHVFKSPPDCPGKAVPRLRFAMESFRTPAVAPVKPTLFFAPTLAVPACAQERRVIMDDYHRLRHA
jgi:hypothetical protein